MMRKKNSDTAIKEFQKKILVWYKTNKRDFPWRKTENPYFILVSEVMLQQTQTMRVIPYYEKFVKKYPTVKSLSAAKNNELLRLWSGLGFNNRAVRLKETANAIVQEYKGIIPSDYKKLIKLKGIGTYTASAIIAFAFNKKISVVDTNIRRVLIHELQLARNISPKKLEEIALLVVPNGRSRIWYNALMDYGALAATSKATKIKPVSKQSPFKGSTREVRGKILRLLLKQKKLFIPDVEKNFLNFNIQDILNGMELDKLISKGGNLISLKK